MHICAWTYCMHTNAEHACADPACDAPCYNIQQHVHKRRSTHCKCCFSKETVKLAVHKDSVTSSVFTNIAGEEETHQHKHSHSLISMYLHYFVHTELISSQTNSWINTVDNQINMVHSIHLSSQRCQILHSSIAHWLNWHHINSVNQ